MIANQTTTNKIESIIYDLLLEVDNQIDQARLIKNTPYFTAYEMLDLIYEVSHLALIQPPEQRQLQQENILEVLKLEKDTLMPKDLSQEKIRIQSPRKGSPRSSASSMRKLTFQRRETSKLMDKLKQVSFTDKKSIRRSSKKVDETVYVQIKSQQANDQQFNVDSLRQKTEARLQQMEALNKIKTERQKLFQSKLNELNHLKQDPKGHVTYDYEGVPIPNNIGEYENLKINMTKTGIGFATKRLKEGISKLNTPQESKIQIRRPSKSFKEQLSGTLRPLEMPMFPMRHTEDGQEAKNLKLEEYRKFYGYKYNRIENRNRTIDMNSTTRTTQKQVQIIEKKHLKDINNQQLNLEVKARATHRKLALPKLNGKYKVLDRYE